ncbi:PTS sugar transporter subunit IIB [Amedibacillus sp. YH-ame6]
MSNLVGLRVDERLIHGQVATAWTNKVGAQRIMVIDDLAVKSDMDKMALKMACPANCKLSILSSDKAVWNLKDNKYGDEKIFIVCKHPKYFLKLLENEIYFDDLVLGNMSSRIGSKMLRKSVYVTDEDIQIIKQITDKGVHVVLQMTPGDTKEDFLSLIND